VPKREFGIHIDRKPCSSWLQIELGWRPSQMDSTKSPNLRPTYILWNIPNSWPNIHGTWSLIIISVSCSRNTSPSFSSNWLTKLKLIITPTTTWANNSSITVPITLGVAHVTMPHLAETPRIQVKSTDSKTSYEVRMRWLRSTRRKSSKSVQRMQNTRWAEAHFLRSKKITGIICK